MFASHVATIASGFEVGPAPAIPLVTDAERSPVTA
jgi:hypothetical protein